MVDFNFYWCFPVVINDVFFDVWYLFISSQIKNRPHIGGQRRFPIIRTSRLLFSYERHCSVYSLVGMNTQCSVYSVIYAKNKGHYQAALLFCLPSSLAIIAVARIAHLSTYFPSSITGNISSGLTMHSDCSLHPLHRLNCPHHWFLSIVVVIRIVLVLFHHILGMLFELFKFFFHISP